MPLFDWIQMNLNSTRLRRMKYPLSTHLSTWLTGQLLPLVPVWVASNMSVSYVPRLMLLLLLFILAYGAWDVSKDSLGWLLTGYSWFEFMFMGWEGVGGGFEDCCKDHLGLFWHFRFVIWIWDSFRALSGFVTESSFARDSLRSCRYLGSWCSDQCPGLIWNLFESFLGSCAGLAVLIMFTHSSEFSCGSWRIPLDSCE